MKSRTERIAEYGSILTEADRDGGVDAVRSACRELCLHDLFYLLAFAMGRDDVRVSDWLYDRCMEVQDNPDGFLDLWAREHYKSTIITLAKTIQDILTDPSITVGIFSHTKPIARAFLRQIKYELETNVWLKDLFPDVLYQDPKKDAPAVGNSWSEDKGITVKRACNDKESTVEAHGLVDGQPTGKHFKLLVYDDVVTLESVNTPEMIHKTTDALALSYNLGAQGGVRRFIGTRYHFADTYAEIIKRGTAKKRIYPATDDGTSAGNPVFFSAETLSAKRRDMGSMVYACQMLQDPLAAGTYSLQNDWLKYWPGRLFDGLNLYLLCDPANTKKKKSDYTSFFVIGLGMDLNYYVVDMIRDKLNLGERAAALFKLHRKYHPLAVGYEEYGLQADVEFFEMEMKRLNYRFEITKMGGKLSKNDRIARLIPLFEGGRLYMPSYLHYTDYEQKQVDLVQAFIEEEYIHWPVSAHDDMLDCLSRIVDIDPQFPLAPWEQLQEQSHNYEEASY